MRVLHYSPISYIKRRIFVYTLLKSSLWSLQLFCKCTTVTRNKNVLHAHHIHTPRHHSVLHAAMCTHNHFTNEGLHTMCSEKRTDANPLMLQMFLAQANKQTNKYARIHACTHMEQTTHTDWPRDMYPKQQTHILTQSMTIRGKIGMHTHIHTHKQIQSHSAVQKHTQT